MQDILLFFRTSRAGPDTLLFIWQRRSFHRGQSGRGTTLTTSLYLVPRLRTSGAVPPVPYTPSRRVQRHLYLFFVFMRKIIHSCILCVKTVLWTVDSLEGSDNHTLHSSSTLCSSTFHLLNICYFLSVFQNKNKKFPQSH
jgi:hypothetical protein